MVYEVKLPEEDWEADADEYTADSPENAAQVWHEHDFDIAAAGEGVVLPELHVREKGKEEVWTVEGNVAVDVLWDLFVSPWD